MPRQATPKAASTRTTPPAGPRLYGWDQLRERGLTFTNRGLKKLEVKGAFPPRVRLSQQRIAWDGAAVDRWIQERINEAATTN